MQEGQTGQIEVYETRRFSKALSKLSEPQLKIVEDEIDKIINDPVIGEQKKGDLDFLWVHKFRIDNQLTLLGYSWLKDKVELYLLSVGSHENFYQQQKQQRKADLKIIG